MSAWARSIQDGTMLASPGVDDGQDLERLDVELERVDRAGRVLRLADRARAEAGARSMGDRVVERRADDRDVHLAPSELGRIGDPGQLHERGRPDVGRQVEVVVRVVLAVPAVGVREIAVEVGIGWALSHGVPPRTVAASDRGGRDPSRWERRRFETSRPAGRASAMVVSGPVRGTPARRPRRAPDPRTAHRRSGRRGSPRAG